MNHNIGIYGFFVGDTPYYVGQSRNMPQRKNNHFHNLRAGKHSNDRLQKSYNKYKEDMVFKVIEEVSTPQELTAREKYWIKILSPKCNFMLPSVENWTLDAEARKKISRKVSGSLNGSYGKKAWNRGLTKENCPKIAEMAKNLSEKKKGVQPKHLQGIMDEEIRKKISIAHQGMKVSEEARRKMSVARKGKPLGLFSRAPRYKDRWGEIKNLLEEGNSYYKIGKILGLDERRVKYVTEYFLFWEGEGVSPGH